ncbi:unnamed protein product [Rotaria sordida]|uniref:Uncharacterized protein n=1 Tax=Rotaria sordida TaxID=392033 RepID=A0A818ND61_9BILA|nr:unnamed protein product [Rotaria sordida]
MKNNVLISEYHNTFIVLGHNSSPFTSINIYATGSLFSSFAIAVGNFNDDTQLDIVVANRNGDNVSVLLGYGNAMFANQTTYFTSYDSSPYFVAVGDINYDSLLYIAVANAGTNNIGVFLGYANRTFANQTTYSTGSNSYPSSVAIVIELKVSDGC